MISRLKDHIFYFLKDKVYLCMLIISAIAGYGYQLGHGTCGVDDIVIDMYFEDGLGVAIGRWPFFYINKIINISPYKPFIMDFLAVLLLMAGAVIWCALIREVLTEELDMRCYIVFSSMFLLYSLIAEVFIYYLHNGIAINYCLVGISLFAFYHLFGEGRKYSLKEKILITIPMIIMVCVAISFYESSANLYLFGALMLIFIDLMQRNRLKADSLKKSFQLMGYTAGVLGAGIVIRSIITNFTMSAFELKEYFFRSITSVTWLLDNNIREIYVELVMLFKKMICDYFAAGTVFYPIMLFVLSTVGFIIFVIYKAIRKKSIWIFLYGAATYASLYVLTIIQGDTLKYRSCQMFSIFVGGMLLIATDYFLKQKKLIKTIGLLAVTGVLGFSAVDLTKWFMYDYEKQEMELQIVDKIASDLQNGGYDISNKPIVFVGDFQLDSSILDKCYVSKNEFGYGIMDLAYRWRELGRDEYCYTHSLQNSVIHWAVEGLQDYGGYNKPMQELFEYRGYSFIWADSQLYKEIMPIYYDYYGEGYEYMKTEMYNETEQYPHEGYIEETDSYIVVKL